MNRTGIILPEFTRVIWSSADAQKMWEPEIQKVSNYVTDMELQSVLRGRKAIQSASGQRFAYVSNFAHQNGLVIIALGATNSINYQSSPSPYNPNQPFAVKYAILRPEYVENFIKDWRSGDNDAIGLHLGFPRCCRAFFNRVWVEQKYLDTTWAMGEDRALGNNIEAGGPDECNIMLRWMGVRSTPHLPCSFHCHRTVDFADTFNDKSRPEYASLMEMLSWPIEWSALHGIARIKTPLFEIVTRTDHTNEKYTVRREGKKYPTNGARGLVFPFRSRPEQEVQVSASESIWKDNGFSTKEAMQSAHAIILNTLIPVTPELLCIHDFGCGNGMLLSQISNVVEHCSLHGVDIKEFKNPKSNIHLHQADIMEYHEIFKHTGRGGLVLMSVNRFDDVKDVEKLKHVLRYSGEFFLFYSYDKSDFQVDGAFELLNEQTNGITYAKLYRQELGKWQGISVMKK
jgi:hypothetical protein